MIHEHDELLINDSLKHHTKRSIRLTRPQAKDRKQIHGVKVGGRNHYKKEQGNFAGGGGRSFTGKAC